MPSTPHATDGRVDRDAFVKAVERAKLAQPRSDDERTAKSAFEKLRLRGKELQEMNEQRKKINEDAEDISEKEEVIETAQLKQVFAELGDEVDSKSLFALVQQADPEAEGVIKVASFMEVVRARQELLAEQRRKQQLTAAYIALGGTTDHDKRVKSDMLKAITSDFVGKQVSSKAMEAVVAHKWKSIKELLDMGGSLDEDEEEELKDTTMLSFEELEAFSDALHGAGSIAEEAGDDDPGDADGASVLR